MFHYINFFLQNFALYLFFFLYLRFKDVVECDRIVVKAFETTHEVASFRAYKLSDDFYHKKAEFERRKTQLTNDNMTRDPTRDIMTGKLSFIVQSTLYLQPSVSSDYFIKGLLSIVYLQSIFVLHV